jgi:hypothetical protein
VGYTAEDSFVLWNTMEEKLFQCGLQQKKTSALLDTTEENFPGKILKLFCGVSHTGGKPLSLYPTPEKNLFRCIPHLKKNLTLKNNCWKKNFQKKTLYL